jgi:hypothetical protein
MIAGILNEANIFLAKIFLTYLKVQCIFFYENPEIHMLSVITLLFAGE